MATAILHSRAVSALNSPSVIIEVHLSRGLPAFHLVGLPEAAVREAKDRVRSAILNSQFEFPCSRITINLAPADLPKTGGRYDLAIALGILVASKQIPSNKLNDYEFLGELALTGEIRAINGVVNAGIACCKNKRKLIIPVQNSLEASLAIGEDQYLSANHLLDVCAHLKGQQPLLAQPPKITNATTIDEYKDMADIKGQQQAKRALEIAAAGSHNLLYSGPPGCGKSMLAERLPGILPDMSKAEALEQLAIQSSLHSEPDLSRFQLRPFRSPHHSSSAAAIVGGGNPIRPGEISQAHHGVLYLDELPEFARPVLDALREPLETRQVSIARANAQATYPASFQLIAAMNPCPCGFYADGSDKCQCSLEQIRRYSHKVSGPLLDRIDLQLQLQPTPLSLITQDTQNEESSSQIKKRVSAARNIQLARQGKANALLSSKELQLHQQVDDDAMALLEKLATALQLSARGLQRCIRVARTIADLQSAQYIGTDHISEACSYRQKV